MERMKNAFVALVCAAAVLATIPSTALAWNAGTHAYIASELNKKSGLTDRQLLVNRLYGSNGPDLFNYAFSQPYLTLADYLHDYIVPDVPLALWNAAVASGDPALIEYGYGFASHDNTWGADATAHRDAITGDLREGYAVAKGKILAEVLRAALAQQQIVVPEDKLQLAAHVLTEIAVDLQVKKNLDPDIGAKLLGAVDGADPRIGGLLATAYAPAFAPYLGGEAQAAGAIQAMEQIFRGILHSYAVALSQQDAFLPVAAWTAVLAESLLGMPAAMLQPLVVFGLDQATALTAPDYQREIFATIGWVNGNLSSRAVSP
jgi:hypothetical protein